jgi:hypothetical protein
MKITTKGWVKRTYPKTGSSRLPFEYFADIACKDNIALSIPWLPGKLISEDIVGHDGQLDVFIEIVPDKESLKAKRSDLIKELAAIDAVLGVT